MHTVAKVMSPSAQGTAFLQVVIENEYWRVQRRHLQVSPKGNVI